MMMEPASSDDDSSNYDSESDNDQRNNLHDSDDEDGVPQLQRLDPTSMDDLPSDDSCLEDDSSDSSDDDENDYRSKSSASHDGRKSHHQAQEEEELSLAERLHSKRTNGIGSATSARRNDKKNKKASAIEIAQQRLLELKQSKQKQDKQMKKSSEKNKKSKSDGAKKRKNNSKSFLIDDNDDSSSCPSSSDDDNNNDSSFDDDSDDDENPSSASSTNNKRKLSSSSKTTKSEQESLPKKKKKSKHAPTTASSTRSAFYQRGAPNLNSSGIGVEIGAHKYKPRDPRISEDDNMDGGMDAETFEKRYEFLHQVQAEEIQRLKERCKAWKKTGRKGTKLRRKLGMTMSDTTQEDDEAELKRLVQQRATRQEQQLRQTARKKVNRELKTRVASGKQGAFYLKKRDRKRMELEAKFDELRKKGGESAVNKVLSKRRKKNMAKDSNLML